MKPRAGDLIIFRNRYRFRFRYLINWFIRKFTNNKWTHAGILLYPKYKCMIESTSKGVHKSYIDIKKYEKDYYYAILRPNNMTKEQADGIVIQALELAKIHAKYDRKAIISLAELYINKWLFFNHNEKYEQKFLEQNPHKFFCIELFTRLAEKEGYEITKMLKLNDVTKIDVAQIVAVGLKNNIFSLIETNYFREDLI